jgi:4-hydroxy-tetrahydrodipicolinate synthase
MSRFSGVIPPVVTPLSAHDQLDSSAVDAVVEHLIAGGVSGLFVLGTTGEGPSLTYQIRYEMVERTCEAAQGRLPVLTGITDTSYAESLALAEHASSSGASAVVAAAPFYYDISQQDLKAWFDRLADESPLPVMLYNMPSCVGVVLDPEIVGDLSHHPNIIGIKDSGGDLKYFEGLCRDHRHRDDFLIFMGPEELLAEAVSLGADGGVCGGANLFPVVYSRLYEAAVRGDASEISRWKGAISRIFESIYRDGQGRMKLIPALKLAMQECGLCQSVVAPPLSGVSPEHAAQIQRALPDLSTVCEFVLH